MNDILGKILLAGYHTWNAFKTKAKEKIEKCKEKEDSRYICQKGLGKTCF